MASKLTRADRAIVRLADGTVKQQNLLTGTEVWTVPGRSNRPLTAPHTDHNPIDHEADGHHCAFCSGRYLETPPEKSRLVRREDGSWEQLDALGADQLGDTVAEFRRIPNLFEIVSYNYWHLNHGHVPSENDRRRMAHYLASDAGYEHVMNVVRARMLASGMSEGEFAATSETARLQYANGFFSGGHDLIIGKRHFVDGATEAHQLAGSGTLTPEEHEQYTAYTARSMRDLYDLDPAVRYVATFQNWLRPAGASFDHLHKQLVAIDDLSVQTEAELERLRAQPDIYDQIFTVAATRKLLIAQNEHAVALAGFGHRFPGIAIWPLGEAANPWEVSPEAMRGISDILHAAHAATGVEVPANEEWYHRPPTVSTPMRWRILLKWRISTLAGFEGGTRIYLNTIDPWKVVERTVPRLLELREAGLIAPMRIGEEAPQCCEADSSTAVRRGDFYSSSESSRPGSVAASYAGAGSVSVSCAPGSVPGSGVLGWEGAAGAGEARADAHVARKALVASSAPIVSSATTASPVMPMSQPAFVSAARTPSIGYAAPVVARER